jgi:hypothetical protein
MRFTLLVLHLESQQPPAGYDAVIGEPGGDLNYDECIGTCKQLVISWSHTLIPVQYIK